MSKPAISRTVRDVFTKEFEYVQEDDPLSTCLSRFREEVPPVLAVLDSEGRYKGVLARRWIVRSRLNPATTKAETLMRPAPTVALNDLLSKVARLMIESDVRQLPVLSGDDLLGFVTDEDVIHGTVLEKWGNTRVEDIMTKKLFVVEKDESIGSMISLFREQGISHAPVVSYGELVGMISIHDIIEHVYQPRQRQTRGEMIGEKIPVLSTPVKGVMSSPVITVLPTDTMKKAAEQMHRFNISSLVVVSKGRPVGIVTKRDFLEPIAQMERVERRLTVQFSIKDDVEIDATQRGFIMVEFESFASRFGKTLEAGTLFVYMKTHGSNYTGRQLIHCRLQLRSRKGSFFASSEGWNVEETFRIALDRLEKQVLRSRAFEHKPEYARNYLRRLRFPQAEL